MKAEGSPSQHTTQPGEFGGAHLGDGSSKLLREMVSESDLAWYQRMTIMAVHAFSKRILPSMEETYQALENHTGVKAES